MAQPGAARPASAGPPRPPDPAPPTVARRSAAGASAAPSARTPASTSAGAILRRDRWVVGGAVLSALVAWLPWSKSPGASMFSLTGSTTLLRSVANAWDMPAKVLWTTGSAIAPGGVELGWIVVGLAILMIVGCVRGWSGGALRGLACAQAGVAVVFMAQAYRIVHDTERVVGTTQHYGTTDVLGIGPYLLLVVSLVLLVAPRR